MAVLSKYKKKTLKKCMTVVWDYLKWNSKLFQQDLQRVKKHVSGIKCFAWYPKLKSIESTYQAAYVVLPTLAESHRLPSWWILCPLISSPRESCRKKNVHQSHYKGLGFRPLYTKLYTTTTVFSQICLIKG